MKDTMQEKLITLHTSNQSGSYSEGFLDAPPRHDSSAAQNGGSGFTGPSTISGVHGSFYAGPKNNISNSTMLRRHLKRRVWPAIVEGGKYIIFFFVFTFVTLYVVGGLSISDNNGSFAPLSLPETSDDFNKGGLGRQRVDGVDRTGEGKGEQKFEDFDDNEYTVGDVREDDEYSEEDSYDSNNENEENNDSEEEIESELEKVFESVEQEVIDDFKEKMKDKDIKAVNVEIEVKEETIIASPVNNQSSSSDNKTIGESGVTNNTTATMSSTSVSSGVNEQIPRPIVNENNNETMMLTSGNKSVAPPTLQSLVVPVSQPVPTPTQIYVNPENQNVVLLPLNDTNQNTVRNGTPVIELRTRRNDTVLQQPAAPEPKAEVISNENNTIQEKPIGRQSYTGNDTQFNPLFSIQNNVSDVIDLERTEINGEPTESLTENTNVIETSSVHLANSEPIRPLIQANETGSVLAQVQQQGDQPIAFGTQPGQIAVGNDKS